MREVIQHMKTNTLHLGNVAYFYFTVSYKLSFKEVQQTEKQCSPSKLLHYWQVSKAYFRELFKKYNILTFVNEYLFSLLSFVIKYME